MNNCYLGSCVRVGKRFGAFIVLQLCRQMHTIHPPLLQIPFNTCNFLGASLDAQFEARRQPKSSEISSLLPDIGFHAAAQQLIHHLERAYDFLRSSQTVPIPWMVTTFSPLSLQASFDAVANGIVVQKKTYGSDIQGRNVARNLNFRMS